MGERGISIRLMPTKSSQDSAVHVAIPADMPAASRAPEASATLAALEPDAPCFAPSTIMASSAPGVSRPQCVRIVKNRMRKLGHRRWKTRKDAKAAVGGHKCSVGQCGDPQRERLLAESRCSRPWFLTGGVPSKMHHGTRRSYESGAVKSNAIRASRTTQFSGCDGASFHLVEARKGRQALHDRVHGSGLVSDVHPGALEAAPKTLLLGVAGLAHLEAADASVDADAHHHHPVEEV